MSLYFKLSGVIDCFCLLDLFIFRVSFGSSREVKLFERSIAPVINLLTRVDILDFITYPIIERSGLVFIFHLPQQRAYGSRMYLRIIVKTMRASGSVKTFRGGFAFLVGKEKILLLLAGVFDQVFDWEDLLMGKRLVPHQSQ